MCIDLEPNSVNTSNLFTLLNFSINVIVSEKEIWYYFQDWVH